MSDSSKNTPSAFISSEQEVIIRAFIANFIIKEKRERVYMQLTNPAKRNRFTDKLNHQWEMLLDMRKLTRVVPENDHPEVIRQILKFGRGEKCYVISNYTEFDNKTAAFTEIFPAVYDRGFATLLLNTSAYTLFLVTEGVKGPAARFTGHSVPKYR